MLPSLLLATLLAASAAAAPSHLSVPAEFICQLSPPGSGDHLLRPSAVFVDRRFGEVLVADSGHNRIVIFDEHGTYRFEFSGAEHYSTAVDLAVDSQGYIYILASTTEGRRILRYDYDGLFLETLPPLEDAGEDGSYFSSLAITADDRLIALDRNGRRICILSRSGKLMGDFPLVEDLDARQENETVFGNIELHGERIYVPLSGLGTVRVFTLAGQHLRSIGHKGSNIGELGFPTDVAITEEGILLVLDKMRFNVVCFDLAGRFLGEFGGKGINPGWFYYPSLLATGGKDRVYVGQIFQNKVQTCRLPDFIRAARRGALDFDEESKFGNRRWEVRTANLLTVPKRLREKQRCSISAT